MPEKIVPNRNEFVASTELTPTQQHEIYDELLQFQKEFGAQI